MLPAFLHRTLPDNQNAAVAEHNWFAGLYGDRPYLVVTDEAHAKQKYQDAQFMWVIDARKEDKLIPIATFMPDRKKYFDRPGRFGAHNIPGDGRKRSIPSHGGRPFRLMVGKQQSNDIGADEHSRLYLIDRAGGAMHILEYVG